MSSKEEEYREIFMAEALDNHQELNRLMTILEQSPNDQKSIHAIFRITHTIKGNATGMGYSDIASLSHAIEDLFDAVRSETLSLDENIISSIYRAVDKLGALIEALKTGKSVRFKGIKAKLEVILKGVGTGEESTEKKNDDNRSTETTTPCLETTVIESDDNAPETSENIDQQIDPAIEKEEESGDQDDAANISFSNLIQVPVKKLDGLMNLVGELIIERDRLMALAHANGQNEYARLYRISSDLQYSVMDVRLVQVGFLFNKFHRIVRDAANSEHKKVKLHLEGAETEIDRNILQVISDSLIHLIRNAIGHGIESPDNRKASNKPKVGNVTLRASNENDNVLIEIIDDGGGVDQEIIKNKAIAKGIITEDIAKSLSKEELTLLIFEPGFSSLDEANSISGRGVGMDVVKKAMDSIGGNIKVNSEIGKGTTIALSLPASMAVKGALLFMLNKDPYAIPLTYTEAVVSLYKSDIHQVDGKLVTNYQDEIITLLFLKDLFQTSQQRTVENMDLLSTYRQLHPEEKLDIVIVHYNNRKVGLVVDRLLQQKEIVEKPLMKPVEFNTYVSGVTILGNGEVCLVLNVANIVNQAFKTGQKRFAK